MAVRIWRALRAHGPQGGGISRTSQAVALTRVRMERPHSPGGDPGAQARLCEGMRPTPGTRLRPMLTARTRFFDQSVLGAIARNVRQIVICGAGYDDRALRFRTPGVRFFELDQGPTQADKARRLHASAPGGTRIRPSTPPTWRKRPARPDSLGAGPLTTAPGFRSGPAGPTRR